MFWYLTIILWRYLTLVHGNRCQRRVQRWLSQEPCHGWHLRLFGMILVRKRLMSGKNFISTGSYSVETRNFLKTLDKSSSPEVFCKKGLLRNFAKFTEKYLPEITISENSKVALTKKTLRHRCFPVNFPKFLRAPFLQNTSGGCF